MKLKFSSTGICNLKKSLRSYVVNFLTSRIILILINLNLSSLKKDLLISVCAKYQ